MNITFKYILIPDLNNACISEESLKRNITIVADKVEFEGIETLNNLCVFYEDFVLFHFLDAEGEPVDGNTYALRPNAFVYLSDMLNKKSSMTINFDPKQY